MQSLNALRRLSARLASLALCAGLLLGGPALAKEQAIPLSSTADLHPAAMLFDYQQLLDLCNQSKGKAYTLSQFTLLNSKGIDDERPPRLFLQSTDGMPSLEIKSSDGLYVLNPRYGRYRATTSNPGKTCSFFVLLRARCVAERTGINKEVLAAIFDNFKDFADAQMAEAKKHYGAAKRDEFWRIRELITPDELVIVFHSAELARQLAEQTSTRAEGRALRITDRRLLAITAPRAKEIFDKIHADAIECVTPWRQMEELPEIRDGAALLQVGWISYRSDPKAPLRSEILTLALRNRK